MKRTCTKTSQVLGNIWIVNNSTILARISVTIISSRIHRRQHSAARNVSLFQVSKTAMSSGLPSVVACEPVKAPPATKYESRTYWQMDAKESIFRNSGAAIFNRGRTDILKEKYHLRERSLVPAPGTYNNSFSEFSGHKPSDPTKRT